jgi:hypothetical protein
MEYSIWRLGLFIKEAIGQINDLVLAIFWSCVVFVLALLVYGMLSGWKYKIEKRIWLREHGSEEQDYHTDTSQKIAKQEFQHASQRGFSKNHENPFPQQKQKNSCFNPQTWKKFYYGELYPSDPSLRKQYPPLTTRDKIIFFITFGPIIAIIGYFLLKKIFF